MQLSARLANPVSQRLLDHHVDVFKAFIEDEIAPLNVALDAVQPLDDLFALIATQQGRLLEHHGMRDGAGDVVLVEPPVIGDRFHKRLSQRVGRLADTGLPGFGFGHGGRL